jgi:hypothetical protein
VELAVRQAVTMEIVLSNPLPKPAHFLVRTTGHALLGAREVGRCRLTLSNPS